LIIWHCGWMLIIYLTKPSLRIHLQMFGYNRVTRVGSVSLRNIVS